MDQFTLDSFFSTTAHFARIFSTVVLWDFGFWICGFAALGSMSAESSNLTVPGTRVQRTSCYTHAVHSAPFGIWRGFHVES